MISKKFAAIVAASMIFGSSAAIARSAAPLSIAGAPAAERAGAEADSASDLRGSTRWIIGAVALALIIWGAIELFDDDPDSP